MSRFPRIAVHRRSWLRRRGRAAGALIAGLLAVGLQAAPVAATVVPVHITKAFGAPSVPLNGTTSLTFTIANGNTSLGITDISFSDGFPTGLVFVQLVSNGCGGVVTTSSTSVALSGAALPGRTTCKITTTVEATGYGTNGSLDNSVQVTANIGPGNTSTASLIVARPPTTSTTFTNLAHVGISWTAAGSNVLLNLGLSNPNTLTALSGVGFTSTLPSGLAIASPNGLAAAGGCTTSEITAVPGSQTLSLAGASLAASPDPNATCSITVTLHATGNGSQSVTAGPVSSNEAQDGVAPTAILSVVGSGPRLYWGTYTQAQVQQPQIPQQPTGTIQFARLDGSVGATLLQSTTSGGTAGTAVDAAAGRVYWIDQSGAMLRWASLDDSGSGTIALTGAPTSVPAGLAIDPKHGRIYWASSGGNAIGYADYKLGTAGTLYTPATTGGANLYAPTGVAIDPAANRIYWANVSLGGGSISYANLDGSGSGANVDTTGATVDEPAGLVVDHANQLVYWANNAGNKISMAQLDGSGAADLNTSGAVVSSPQGLAFDLTTRRLWWANAGNGTIASVQLDSTGTNASGGASLTVAGLHSDAPNYPALLYAPKSSSAPVLTGSGAAGVQLSCSKGTWAADNLGDGFYRAAHSFAYHWQNGGTAIAGATSSTYTPSVAGQYTCTVTATNAAGQATSKKSNVADAVAPTVSAPTAIPASGATLGTTIPVKVTWTGTDAGSGIDHYEVWLSTNGGAYVKVASPATATYTAAEPPSNTTTYRFEVRGIDKAGNVSAFAVGPTFHVELIDQTSSAVTWSGAWTTVSNASASGGSYRYASAAGASASFTFTGRAVGLVGLLGTAYGDFEVFLDGVDIGPFSEASASTIWKDIVYAKSWSSSASHTVKVVCNATSGHPRIDVDAFVVL